MRKNLILYMAIAVLAFAGCKKETNVTTLRATIQGFHSAKDAKVYIDAQHYACWHTTGDQVILNNSTQSVTKDDNNYYQIAVAEGDQNATMFYSIYPASAVNGTSVRAQTSVTLPAVQVYQEVEGKQVVEALMAAMGEQRLEFKNLCALLEVEVTDLPSDAWLTKIEVTTTTGAALCGTGNVTFTASNITLGALSGGINGGKTIKLQFDTDLKKNGKYYVVVPPVSNTGFEINIHYRRPNTTEGENNEEVIHLFTKRLKQTTTTNSLGASEFGGITVDMDHTTPEEHLPGAYSVSTTNQVYFSRGNLKYDNSQTPKWSFEHNQTKYTPFDKTNSGVSSTGYMPFWCNDNMTEPMLHDNSYQGTAIDYGSFAAPATTSGAWRTLSKDEWNFLVSRPSHGIGSPLGSNNVLACYAYVQVNGVNGMMLFPDLFEWPTTVSTDLIPGTLNAASSTWNGIDYSATDWAQLEDAGCIFLQAGGWTSWQPIQQGTHGYYWSSTPRNNNSNNKDAYYFFFNPTNSSLHDGGTWSYSPTANQYESYGHGYMVRLVYDPNATPRTSSK